MTIISLSGFIGSGKSTAAQHLVDKHGFVAVSFASPLKDILSTVFGWDREQLDGLTAQSRKWRTTMDPYWSLKLGRMFSPRDALTEIGTDLFRNRFSTAIWVSSLEKKCMQLSYQGKDVVITDARFSNELALVQSMDGSTIRIQRGDLPEWNQLAVKASQFPNTLYGLYCRYQLHRRNIHRSEWEWCGHQFSNVLVNNTIPELHKQLDDVVAELKK